MSKTVLVSGGTNGIGKATVLQLLSDGFNVSTFSRGKDNCVALEAELAGKFDSKRFLVLTADVSSEKDVLKVVSKTLQKFGKIDVLVNNAGFGYYVDVEGVDLQRFKEMIDTNLFGTVLLTTHVVPLMKKQKAGLVVNLVSISGKTVFPRGEFYSATKFGVMGFSEGLRKELGSFGIKVSTICPGMVKTGFFGEKELERRRTLNNGKLPPMLEPSDVSRVISFVCSQSEYCDIQDLTVMPF